MFRKTNGRLLTKNETVQRKLKLQIQTYLKFKENKKSNEHAKL